MKNMLMREDFPKARVGFFAVGHRAYWAQFEGLLDTLLRYHGQAGELVAANGVEVVDYGMVDTNARAFEVAARMGGDRLDLIICDMVTYATSSAFAPIVQAAAVPVVLLALQPLSAMDYTAASTRMQLENDNICSVPEFTGVAERFGRPVADVVIGTLRNDPRAAAHLGQWCGIARALRGLKGARIGLMGHVLEAMYDMHADPTAVSAAFGVHVPLLEVDDLLARYDQVTEEEIRGLEALILENFDCPDPKSDPVTRKLTPEDLRQAAHSAAALDRFVRDYGLTGLAYYYEGRPGSPQRRAVSSLIVGNSMLIARGVPMCGEYDVKTCLAMLVMDRLGNGGSFAELHPFDFNDNCILVGHDGPHHMALAEGKPVLRSLVHYHGKPGSGASVEFKLKEGPVTMLGIGQTANGRFRFVIGEGLSAHGPIPPTGNTNTRCSFGPDTREFIRAWVMAGPTHHFALGVGHFAGTLKKLAGVLGVDCAVVRAD